MEINNRHVEIIIDALTDYKKTQELIKASSDTSKEKIAVQSYIDKVDEALLSLLTGTDLTLDTRIKIISIADKEDKELEGLTGIITHPFPGLMWPGVKYVAGVYLDSKLTNMSGNKINLTACDKLEVCTEEFNSTIEKILHPENITDEELQALWNEFGDTPIKDNDEIDEAFYIWPKGTNRFDIWQWFNKYHSKGIAEFE